MPLTREDLIDRLPAFIRQDPVFGALVGTGGDLTESYQTVCQAVINAFDLETAEGEQLDRIGEIVQYARQGEDDDRYRRLVRMQIQTILSSAGTTAVLLEIVRIWTGVEAPYYAEPPSGRAELQIGAMLEALDESIPLVLFLRRAKAGGVRLTLFETVEEGLLLDYTPASPVDDAGVLDYMPASLVTGAGAVGHVTVI